MERKHHRSQFPTSGGKRSEEPLSLVHSDVCGKMSAPSLSAVEYFITFINDKTRHVCSYAEGQSFQAVSRVESSGEKLAGRKLKALHTDNGGE